jgi:hypothetical protein
MNEFKDGGSDGKAAAAAFARTDMDSSCSYEMLGDQRLYCTNIQYLDEEKQALTQAQENERKKIYRSGPAALPAKE